MEKFVIQGGVPLSGEVIPAGNKNAALPILAASLLTEEELVLHNVPRIRDVDSQIELLEALGVKVSREGEHTVRLQADSVADTAVDEGPASRIRASFLAAGPLLARFGSAKDASSRRRHDRETQTGSPPGRVPRPRRASRGRYLGRTLGSDGRSEAWPDLHG